ncbi:MAG: hypothetical protein ABIQ56_03675 [Chitinophagaceae bacterium]
MKKFSLVFLMFVAIHLSGTTQKLSVADLKSLKTKEDSLKIFALRIIQGRTANERFEADSQFTRMLVRALKTKHSIQFRFDSLYTISKLSPADSSFKIFTWQMVINDNVVRQHGAIQMKTPDGSLRLFPLIDKSDVTIKPGDTISNNFGWIGAVYYKLIEKEANGRKYYTLLGYDENNIKSNKKVVEVLSFFDKEPVFGGSYFSYKSNTLNQNFGKRFIMEYKKNASPRLTYDKDMDIIIFEHLVSESGEVNKKWTLIPDGDYEGLKWMNGKWVHVESVYDGKVIESRNAVPNPLRDAQGNIIENQLKNNSGIDEPPANGSKKK